MVHAGTDATMVSSTCQGDGIGISHSRRVWTYNGFAPVT